MVANAATHGRDRPRGTGTPDAGYACPTCDGTLERENGTLQCLDCGHVPRHGAD